MIHVNRSVVSAGGTTFSVAALASLVGILMPAHADEYTAGPAVAVRYFEYSGTDDLAIYRKGLTELIVTDLVQLTSEPNSRFGDCKLAVVEWEKRDLIQKELDFQQSRYVDPSSRVEKHWIDPHYFIEGKLTGTADTLEWTLQLRDARSGNVVAIDKGSIPASQALDVSGGIADRFACSLCRKGRDYTGKPQPFAGCTPALPADAPLREDEEPSPRDVVNDVKKAVDKVKSLKGLWGG